MLLRSTTASISRSASGFVSPAAAQRVSASAPDPGRFRLPPAAPAALAYASALSARIEVCGPTPVFHVRPFAFRLLWPRLTSDDPSQHLAMPVAQGRSSDLPGYDAPTFPLMPVGSTSRRSVQVLGFASIGPLTPPCRLYPLPVRQASVLPTASFRFRLATDTLAVQLTLPLAGCVEDFHLQVRAPCRAHQEISPPYTEGLFVSCHHEGAQGPEGSATRPSPASTEGVLALCLRAIQFLGYAVEHAVDERHRFGRREAPRNLQRFVDHHRLGSLPTTHEPRYPTT